MSFAFTPSYTFDGEFTDNGTEGYSSGDDVYDTFDIDEIGVSSSFFTVNFTDATAMSNWRASSRQVTLEYTGSGSKSWEDTYDLTSSEEYSVNTQFNYIHYSWSDMGLSLSEIEDLADEVSSAGNGNTVLNLNNLG